eukprot:1132744-Pelagomonas_calceolata.AAC.9
MSLTSISPYQSYITNSITHTTHRVSQVLGGSFCKVASAHSVRASPRPVTCELPATGSGCELPKRPLFEPVFEATLLPFWLLLLLPQSWVLLMSVGFLALAGVRRMAAAVARKKAVKKAGGGR